MHNERLGRVANSHSLALAVKYDFAGHVEVGGGVDVYVAIASEMLDNRHLGLFGDATNKTLTATRDREVDVLRHLEELADGGAIRGANQLDGINRQTDFLRSLGEQFNNCLA